MIEFQNILCPTDLSDPSLRSLTYAAAIARWYGARLTVLHVVPTIAPVALPPGLSEPQQVFAVTPREVILGELNRVVELVGATDLEPALSVLDGDPTRVIVEQAVATGADLLVMGTHGRSGFERLLIGSIAEKVSRKAPCPVLLVPPHLAEGPPAEVIFKKILCPMDFSPAALQALGFALGLSRQADGTVTVLHAIEWLSEDAPREHARFNVVEYRAHLIADARQRLHELVEGESRTWTKIEEEVVVGRAYHKILDHAAEQGSDLIVMGAQGRGGLGLTLFGSTTEQVVRGATCPVLAVRAADPQR